MNNLAINQKKTISKRNLVNKQDEQKNLSNLRKKNQTRVYL